MFFILYSLFFIHSDVYASTHTYYLGSSEITYDDSGKIISERKHFPGAVENTDRVTGKKELSYTFSDNLGSVALVTDAEGTVKASSIYYPYGDVPDGTSLSAGITDKLYTGQRKDSSTNLYFYNARYYNPKTGHFISADKAQGNNRYAYVGNNPIMRNDPSGLMFKKDDGGGSSNTSGPSCPIPIAKPPQIKVDTNPCAPYKTCISAQNPNVPVYRPPTRDDAIATMEYLANLPTWEDYMAEQVGFPLLATLSPQAAMYYMYAQTIGECQHGMTGGCAISMASLITIRPQLPSYIKTGYVSPYWGGYIDAGKYGIVFRNGNVKTKIYYKNTLLKNTATGMEYEGESTASEVLFEYEMAKKWGGKHLPELAGKKQIFTINNKGESFQVLQTRWVEGTRIADMRGRMSREQADELFAKLQKGWDDGLIYGDNSPENIVLKPGGEFEVIDILQRPDEYTIDLDIFNTFKNLEDKLPYGYTYP